MTPAEWMGSGGTLGGWIDRGGTLPADIIGRSLRALHRLYPHRDLDFSAEARADGWDLCGEHWRKENAEYFNPLHDSSPREGFALWFRGPATPHGPFGQGFEPTAR